MASTKELRTRIKSISNTAKVTGAMQMIAASKLRKAQNSAEDFNLFSAGYDEIKNSVMGSVNFDLISEISPLFNVGEINSEEKILYVVISSNRGLAGQLFGNLVKVLEAHKINEDSAKFISESCIHINQMLIPGYCSNVGQSNWIATFNSLLCSSYEWGCTDENVSGISKASRTVSKFQPYVIDAIICSG